jgi:hypothetical protein
MKRRSLLLMACGLWAQNGVYRVRLLAPLSTKLNKDGDTINARVVAPAALAGAILEGVVKKSKSSKNFKVMQTKSELLFGFHTLHLKNKQQKAIDTQVLSMKNSKGQKNVDDEGQVVEKSNGAKRILFLTGAGAAIGGVFKREKGAAAGAGIGAAAGVILTTFASSGPNIKFETGSEFELDVKERPKATA